MTSNSCTAAVFATLTLAVTPSLAARAGEAVEGRTVLAPSLAPSPSPTQPAVSFFHADFEVDPTAYVLDGFSLHVGLWWKRLRFDLGNYAIALPKALTGNDDFKVSFDGYGIKVQYFVFSERQEGGFVGVGADVIRSNVHRRGTSLTARHVNFGAGVNFGWRFVFGHDFFATAWLGLGYMPGREQVTLGASTYSGTKFSVFPAVHLGYRFR